MKSALVCATEPFQRLAERLFSYRFASSFLRACAISFSSGTLTERTTRSRAVANAYRRCKSSGIPIAFDRIIFHDMHSKEAGLVEHDREFVPARGSGSWCRFGRQL